MDHGPPVSFIPEDRALEFTCTHFKLVAKRTSTRSQFKRKQKRVTCPAEELIRRRPSLVLRSSWPVLCYQRFDLPLFCDFDFGEHMPARGRQSAAPDKPYFSH